MSGMLPVENVIVIRQDNVATMAGTVVFKVKPTIAEHNVMIEVLRHIRHAYPGAWLVMMDEEKKKPQLYDNDKPWPFPTGPQPTEVVKKVKAISAEHMKIEPFEDVPL